MTTPAATSGKRFHVHVAVANLETSIRFYSTLFAAEPTVQKPDYAKWMLEDPRLNFAISARGAAPGVDHLGFQLDTEAALLEARERLHAADLGVLDQGVTTCCYAESEKHWVVDPQGIAWETFRRLNSVPTYHGTEKPGSSACCAPSSVVTETAVAMPAPKPGVQKTVTACGPNSACC